jgi:hypothetical protein
MIFKGQTITVSLNTGIDLAGYAGVILYEKPNGENGEWSGSISDGAVSYDITTTDIDVAGVWKIQAKATMGSDVKYGKITVLEFRTHL